MDKTKEIVPSIRKVSSLFSCKSWEDSSVTGSLLGLDSPASTSCLHLPVAQPCPGFLKELLRLQELSRDLSLAFHATQPSWVMGFHSRNGASELLRRQRSEVTYKIGRDWKSSWFILSFWWSIPLVPSPEQCTEVNFWKITMPDLFFFYSDTWLIIGLVWNSKIEIFFLEILRLLYYPLASRFVLGQYKTFLILCKWISLSVSLFPYRIFYLSLVIFWKYVSFSSGNFP